MRSFFLLLSLGVFVFFGCSKGNPSSSYMQPSDRIKVLSTTAMIDDIVKRIGKERIDSEILIKGEIDPHSYELVKGDDEKLRMAEVLFYNGLGLEHGASLKEKLSTNPHAIALANAIAKKEGVELIEIEGVADPHVWLDVSLWAEITDPIAEALSLKDPEHRAFFEKNAQEVKKELLHLHQDIQTSLGRIEESKRYLVTCHDAFNYFTRAYLCPHQPNWKEHCAAPEGLAPEGQLSIADIQRIVAFVFSHEVHTVFAESNLSRDALKKVVDACRIRGYDLAIAKERLFGDAMKESKEGYFGMMHHNAQVLLEEWGSDE